MSNTYLGRQCFARKLQTLNTAFEQELSLRGRQISDEDLRLTRLEDKIMQVAGQLEAMLTHAGARMTAHQVNGAQRLERLEATVDMLSAKVQQVCEFIGMPSEAHPARDESPLEYCPALPPTAPSPAPAPEHILATDLPPAPASAPGPSLDLAPAPALDPAPAQDPAPALDLAPDAIPTPAPAPSVAPAVHPGVQLVPATPLNSQESADTHVTLLTAAPATLVPVPAPQHTTRLPTQGNLPVPEAGPASRTRSRSRSRSVNSTVLEGPVEQTRGPSGSHSETSNMDIDEPKRGHKRKASDTKTEREERRQRK
jgi:hypothetical protein